MVTHFIVRKKRTYTPDAKTLSDRPGPPPPASPLSSLGSPYKGAHFPLKDAGVWAVAVETAARVREARGWGR